MTKSELDQTVRRAANAERLLNDPLLAETIQSMRDTVFDNWRTSKHNQADEQKALHNMIQVIDRFEAELKRKIRHGQKAKSLLEKLFNRGE